MTLRRRHQGWHRAELSATQRKHPAQLTFPQRPVFTAEACSRRLATVYDQSPTDLAFALLPVFATLWSEQVSADGMEMLPAAAMEELMARVTAAVIITKDQLLNLAAELLPPERMQELLRYLSQLVGYEEWQQIKHRRRRHLIDISISYLSRARRAQGNLLVEAISRHLYDLNTQTRETHITAYTCRYLDEAHRAEYLGEVEVARARYFREDRVLHMASSQWEVMANRLEPGPEGTV